MQEQINVMLDLQDSMNSKVNSAWREQNFEWYRAIWIECAELLDHHGWKWWKKQSPDVEQVILELIDIWHFGLSILMQSGLDRAEIIAKIESELVIETTEPDFRIDLESFAAITLTTKSFDVAAFARLMAGMQLSFDQLYRGYVGKNVLNFFRQNNGYKDGSYIKVWAGKEDNEHLVEVVQLLDASSTAFSDDVYAALESRYRQLTA